MEAIHVSDAEVRPKLLKAYHSYMAAATQNEQMLVPRIFRDCDPDCRVAVQRSFEANTRIPCLGVDDEVVIQESVLRQFFTGGVDKPLMNEFLEARPDSILVPKITCALQVMDFLDAAPKDAYMIRPQDKTGDFLKGHLTSSMSDF
jgi:hypothetical protein